MTRIDLDRARITGVHTTEQGRLAGRGHHELLLEAIKGAVADAGLGLSDVDGIANIRSTTKSAADSAPAVWAELLGHPLRYHEMVDVAGASHAASISHAAAAISAGLCDTIVVVGGWIRGSRREIITEMAYMHGEFDTVWGSIVPSWFALIAQRYMYDFGLTLEDLARVAVAARGWAALHEQAMRRDPITIDDVMASPFIAEPLRLLDCCQANNGAGAMVLTSAEKAAAAPHRGVRVLGSGEAYVNRAYTDIAPHYSGESAALAARSAFQSSGTTVRDIDVFGLYDPFTITVPILLVALGLCRSVVEVAELLETRQLEPGGGLPVNTHGGALSWGNSLNALAHAIECVRQLQGRADERQVQDAEVAYVHAMGGPMSLHSSVVLAAD